mmetsp:Transcript_17296/g.26762  ORF Transcript_17296/g.26762 Transcript_17296/m.26762 type:complete len:516 (-) Transcript_17296:158-1705(-)
MSAPEVSLEIDGNPETQPLVAASFDLETYIGRYHPSSETRLQRLLFIGEHAPDPGGSSLAWDLAERQMRECGNVRKYREVFSSRASFDAEWADETAAAAQQQLEVLEGRLAAAQSHLNKEAIRAAYLALGDFHRRRGELRDAMRVVLRSREYCTNRGQTGHVCLLVMELAIDLRNYSRVREYVSKAEHTSIPNDINFPSKLRVSSGLAYLAEGRYHEAAQKFISIAGPPLDDFTSVVSTEDVVLFGSLLALATLDRSDLCRMLEPRSTGTSTTSNETANAAATPASGGLERMAAGLELLPPVRDALRHFTRAEYKSCLNLLESLKPQLDLDLHLAPHVTTLFEKIRDKCLEHYLRPYCHLRLDGMAQDFGLESKTLQSILAKLVGQGRIGGNARIDCRTQTLATQHDEQRIESDQERQTKLRLSRLSRHVLNEAHALIIRLACVEHHMVVMSDNKRGSRGAPSGGGSSGGSGYWRPGADAEGLEEIYDGDESSGDGDTPMVLDGDLDMGNPEDLH